MTISLTHDDSSISRIQPCPVPYISMTKYHKINMHRSELWFVTYSWWHLMMSKKFPKKRKKKTQPNTSLFYVRKVLIQTHRSEWAGSVGTWEECSTFPGGHTHSLCRSIQIDRSCSSNSHTSLHILCDILEKTRFRVSSNQIMCGCYNYWTH